MALRPETYIARRLYFSSNGEQRASRPAIRVAFLGIVIGVMVMIMTLCVVVGFKHTVAEKIAGFGAHIQVTSFENNNTFELSPVAVTDSLITSLQALPHVTRVNRFLTKPGLIKTSSDFKGVVLKGTSYWDYFSANLLSGMVPQSSNDIILSRSLAQQMQLAVDSSLLCYFVGEQLRVRKFRVSGIYETGFSDYDNLFLIGQEQTVRQINQWSDSLSSGIEIMVDNTDYLNETADLVYFQTANRLGENGEAYYTQTIEQLNPQIFSWLALLDMNVIVIIILMLCVSGFNIISGLIILILDSIRLIGIIKALGADNRFVRRIFITQSAFLVGKGLLWGNIIGLALAALQYFTHLIPLDATTYYVSYVPIAFPWLGLLALNIGTILLSFLILLAPSAIATRISPAKVMHFE